VPRTCSALQGTAVPMYTCLEPGHTMLDCKLQAMFKLLSLAIKIL